MEMKKQFNMMLIILVCAVLGVVTAIIITNLYNNGIIFDEFITGTISISDLQFIIFFVWIVVGVILGVFES